MARVSSLKSRVNVGVVTSEYLVDPGSDGYRVVVHGQPTNVARVNDILDPTRPLSTQLDVLPGIGSGFAQRSKGFVLVGVTAMHQATRKVENTEENPAAPWPTGRQLTLVFEAMDWQASPSGCWQAALAWTAKNKDARSDALSKCQTIQLAVHQRPVAIEPEDEPQTLLFGDIGARQIRKRLLNLLQGGKSGRTVVWGVSRPHDAADVNVLHGNSLPAPKAKDLVDLVDGFAEALVFATPETCDRIFAFAEAALQASPDDGQARTLESTLSRQVARALDMTPMFRLSVVDKLAEYPRLAKLLTETAVQARQGTRLSPLCKAILARVVVEQNVSFAAEYTARFRAKDWTQTMWGAMSRDPNWLNAIAQTFTSEEIRGDVIHQFGVEPYRTAMHEISRYDRSLGFDASHRNASPASV